MYKNITNPNTGKIVPLNSQKGQKILKNYKLYLFPILIMELIFFMKYNSKFNKFKNLNSNQSSDPIPCSFYVLRKIERFIIKVNQTCNEVILCGRYIL